MSTLVVKYGGSVRDEGRYLEEDIAHFAGTGQRLVVVHGGGPEISRHLARLGLPAQFVAGQRVTDAETLDVVEMVLAGRVGKRIVRALQARGVRAVGISGEDAMLLRTVPYDEQESLGFVGQVERVDSHILEVLLAAGYLPVVAPLGVDANGQVRNINADVAAGALSAALCADAFVLATDVVGVMESATSLHAVPELRVAQALDWIASGIISGGMVPKVMAAVAAVQQGARAAYIVDGRQAGILDAVMTHGRVGTRITGGEDRGGHDG